MELSGREGGDSGWNYQDEKGGIGYIYESSHARPPNREVRADGGGSTAPTLQTRSVHSIHFSSAGKSRRTRMRK